MVCDGVMLKADASVRSPAGLVSSGLVCLVKSLLVLVEQDEQD